MNWWWRSWPAPSSLRRGHHIYASFSLLSGSSCRQSAQGSLAWMKHHGIVMRGCFCGQTECSLECISQIRVLHLNADGMSIVPLFDLTGCPGSGFTARGNRVRIAEYPSNIRFKFDVVVWRALVALWQHLQNAKAGRPPCVAYSLWQRNCENFACWCSTGWWMSDQVITLSCPLQVHACRAQITNVFAMCLQTPPFSLKQ